MPADESDADADGSMPCDGDCDDAAASRFPGNAEACDGIDNDCDLVVPGDEADDDGDGFRICDNDCDDNDATEYPGQNWYVDIDGDGFGGATPLIACEQPASTSLIGTDCDDGDADRFPGNPEVCDGVDNDCDLVVDEGFADADSDGFAACVDCDDTDATFFPGATELCDGLDNDCDSIVPADELDGDNDGFMGCAGDCDDADAEEQPGQTWFPDADNDTYGNVNVFQILCTRPTGWITTGGDCDDTDADAFPGNPELCDGADNDCDGSVPAGESDADADGSMPCDGDCDDAAANRYPGNAEACDGVDNDCDLAVPADESDTDGDGFRICAGDCDDADPNEYPDQTWYSDLDGDGIGAPVPTVACAQPASTSLIGTDCDDTDADRFPGNPEVCDGTDNDCDFVIDEGFPDDDGDTVAACLDCDDTDASSFPGAPELCDGLDNDCDNVVPADELASDGDGSSVCAGDCDDADPDEQPGQTWYADADGDTYGNFNVVIVTCSRPTGYVLDSTDCDDGSAVVSPVDPEICDGLDNDCDGVLPADESDADGDGIRPCAGDCVDTAAAVYPSAPQELCDGHDNDCDPSTTVAGGELDGDGDQFLTCGPFFANGASNSAGQLLAGGNDCDDTDPLRFPTNPELCDGIDNDCIGSTTVALGESDADGDQYMPCAGFVSQGGTNASGLLLLGGADCDETSADRFPGNPEVDACDGFDNDCILDTLEVDDDGDGEFECQGDCDDAAADRFAGNTAAEVCDGYDSDCVFDGDEVDDDSDGWMECEGDCDDTTALRAPGLWDDPQDGLDSDCDTFNLSTTNSGAFSKLDGEEDYGQLGTVLMLGDLDGDGLDEVVAASPLWDGPGQNRGLVAVWFGSSLTTRGTFSTAQADVMITGTTDDSKLGEKLGAAGDVDGDGRADLLIGSTSSARDAWLFFGSTLSAGGLLTDAAADVLFLDVAGEGVRGVGDVDGDTLDDVATVDASADTAQYANCCEGAVHLFPGATLALGGTVTAADSFATIQGVDLDGFADGTLAPLGDLDGDGLADFAFGVPRANQDNGRVYVYLGSTLVGGGALLTTDFETQISGVQGGEAGTALAGIPDIDGDGADELLVSTPYLGSGVGTNFEANVGAVWLYFSTTLLSTTYLSTASASADWSREGGSTQDYLGWAVSSAGDVDGDGLGDLLVGVPAQDFGGLQDAGAAALFLGASIQSSPSGSQYDADALFLGEESFAGSATSVSGAGDVDGDGRDDLLLGAPSQGATSRGRAYVRISPY